MSDPAPATPSQPAGEAAPAWTERLRRVLIGPARDPFAPGVFHHVSLVAFLAWVGLGADGLSSVCYGPEEAFRALEQYRGLALLLAAMTAFTVFVISASYAQIIEAFPSGGGAYVVATNLLGSAPGVIAGTALLVDYVLTISISVASASDAIYSFPFTPDLLRDHRVWVGLAGILVLILMNLRGVRESVTVMAPIFLVFLFTHAAAVLLALVSHGREIGGVAAEALREAHAGSSALGLAGLALVLLRAYSLGGGTYTGIEAVSNSLPVLREPRVKTGKRAMLYMSLSLAFMAGGILLAYLFVHVAPVAGKTLNAVLAERTLGPLPAGGALVFITLLSEALLLYIAAQTGFLGGPQVLAVMAADLWVPRFFQHLSDRLVTRNGVLLMGIAAGLTVVATGGSVALLVVLYSINVFLTFTLSQLGMVRHWWSLGPGQRPRGKLAINALGLVLTGFILVVTIYVKFGQGGWATLGVTGLAVIACFLIRRHYQRVQGLFKRLDETLANLPLADTPIAGLPDPRKATAAVLVGGYGGLGIHTLLSIFRLFGNQFEGIVFLSIGIIDSSKFKNASELERLEASVKGGLERYVDLARRLGVPADSMVRMGTDAVAEIEELAQDVRARYPRAVFFAGKLIFQRESFWTRVLHNQTAEAVQRRLHPKGFPVVILPILAE